MIVDLTKEFHRLSNVPSSPDPINIRSQFLDQSTRVLQQLINIQKKLQNLIIKKFGNLSKEQGTINKQFIQIKQLLKEVEKKVRKCLSLESDVKVKKDLKLKFKENVNLILECKLIECSFSYKKHYQSKIQQSTKIIKKHDMDDDEHRYSKSTFLQQSKMEIMQRQRVQQYQQIEKGISQITETYKSMVEMVRMHDMMVEKIGENTQIAYSNIVEGRRNLSEVSERQNKNRKFIIKVFIILYVFVFIYINILL